MAKLFNDVGVLTATAGTGTVTIGAAIDASYFTPSEAGAVDTDVVTYKLSEGTNIEVGRGTIGGGVTTMTRDVVLRSKIGGVAGTTKITLLGTAELRIVAAAEDYVASDIIANGLLARTAADVYTSRTITGTASQITVTNGDGVAGNPTLALDAAFNDTVTVANEGTDTSCFISFFTAASGELGPKTNAAMTFQSASGVATFTSSVHTTIDVNAGTIDNTAIGSVTPSTGVFTTDVANSFVPNSATVPTNGLYLPAANTLGWAINSAAEMRLTAGALAPAAQGGLTLGVVTTGAWANLFLASTALININQDWIAQHSTGVLTVATGDLRVTNDFSNAESVVTCGGTQTVTGKTIAQASNTLTLTGGSTSAAGVLELAIGSEYRTGTDTTRALGVAETWAAAAEATALTDAATVAVNMANFINVPLTIGGNRTLGAPSNAKVGQSGYIRIIQDATGNRTLAYNAAWEFAGGVAPTLSTAGNSQDMLFYTVVTTSRIVAWLHKAIAP